MLVTEDVQGPPNGPRWSDKKREQITKAGLKVGSRLRELENRCTTIRRLAAWSNYVLPGLQLIALGKALKNFRDAH